MNDEAMKLWMAENNIDPAMDWINDPASKDQVDWYGQQIALASIRLQDIVFSNGLNGSLFEPVKPLWFAEDLGSDGIECTHAVFHQYLFEIDSMCRKAWRAAGRDELLPRTPWIPPAFKVAIH